MKNFLISILASTYLLFGINIGNHNNTNSLDVIKSYTEDGVHNAPTLQDYKNLGLSFVTARNIGRVNKKIAYINSNKGKKIDPYKYDTKRDYLYDFSKTESKKYSLDISDNSIDIEDIDISKNSTIFLKLKIKTTDLGQYFEPSIETKTAHSSSIHRFEPMANGIRYLNLSDLDIKEGDEIKLSGSYITIKDQTAELILFRDDDLSKKRILIIAPHPDDAEIAAFGLYSSFHSNVYIATVTAGEAGGNRLYMYLFPDRRDQYIEKGRLRTFNSLTVPRLGDVAFDHCINLGFFDGTLKKMHENKTENVAGLYTGTSDISTFRKQNSSKLAKNLTGSSNWNSLVENMEYLIKEIKPDVIVTTYPRIDWHNDHKLSTIAIIDALKRLNYKKGKLYLYTNHYPASEYYPYGKEGDPITLPPMYGRTIYFDSLYSHRVTKHTQGRKVLALDSMSDIIFDKKWSNFSNMCQGEIPFICRDLSYFRRSIRSNELFFVVNIENIYDKNILDGIVGK